MSILHSRTALFSVVMLAGCLSAPPVLGQVGVSEVDSAVPADARMALAENESFMKPLPSADNEMPLYPDSMLQHRLPPQAVCVRVSIDEKGGVSATAPIGIGPDCPAEANAASAFYDAAQAAAAQWHYEPAFRCIFPKHTKAPRSGCLGERVKEVPEAVSLVYRFVFEQTDGKGAVRLMN
jgi:hypothetical protein